MRSFRRPFSPVRRRVPWGGPRHEHCAQPGAESARPVVVQGLARLMDVLADRNEIIRNEVCAERACAPAKLAAAEAARARGQVLLVLVALTQGSLELNKIMAFEGAFDILLGIAEQVHPALLRCAAARVRGALRCRAAPWPAAAAVRVHHAPVTMWARCVVRAGGRWVCHRCRLHRNSWCVFLALRAARARAPIPECECARAAANLLRSNPSNANYFREMGCVPHHAARILSSAADHKARAPRRARLRAIMLPPPSRVPCSNPAGPLRAKKYIQHCRCPAGEAGIE